jgi:hypothetical protein
MLERLVRRLCESVSPVVNKDGKKNANEDEYQTRKHRPPVVTRIANHCQQKNGAPRVRSAPTG